MGLVLLNGQRVLAAVISRPLMGNWHADLEIDTSDAPVGAATISIADGRLELVGTILRAEPFAGGVRARMVGGAGALSTTLPAKAYGPVTLRVLLADLLSAAGERLATSSDADQLARSVSSWTRTQGPASIALGALVERAPGCLWRVTASGAVFVGVNTWPAVTLAHEVLSEDQADGHVMLATDDPTLTAGVTLEGRRISYVRHTYAPDRVRTEAWLA